MAARVFCSCNTIVYLLTTLNYERSAGREQVLGTCISEGSQPGKRVRAIRSLVVTPKGRSRAHPSRGSDTKNKAYPEKKGIGGTK